MGFLDLFFPSPEKKIEQLKEKGKIYEIMEFLNSDDQDVKRKAVEALSELLESGKLSQSEETTVVEKLDPIIRIKDRRRIDNIGDAFELRRVAINEYLPRNDFSIAIYALEKALEKRPGDVSIMNNLAAAFSMKGDFEHAQEVWEEILQEKNGEPTAVKNYSTALHLQASKMLRQKEDSSDAADMLLRAIEINPNHINSLYELANYYLNTKSHDKAIYYFKKCLANARIPSGFSSLTEFRGTVSWKIADEYREKSEAEDAVEYYKQALRIHGWDEPEKIRLEETIKELGGGK